MSASFPCPALHEGTWENFPAQAKAPSLSMCGHQCAKFYCYPRRGCVSFNVGKQQSLEIASNSPDPFMLCNISKAKTKYLCMNWTYGSTGQSKICQTPRIRLLSVRRLRQFNSTYCELEGRSSTNPLSMVFWCLAQPPFPVLFLLPTFSSASFPAFSRS